MDRLQPIVTSGGLGEGVEHRADAGLVSQVCAAGIEAGLHRVGVAAPDVFSATRRDLVERKAAGLHGGMQFTYRNPQRSTDPQRILAGACAIVVGARAYPRPRAAPRDDGSSVTGRVAAYAAGDNYGALRAGLGAVADALDGAGWQAVVVADDNALVDRAAAHRAGIGWWGKNANLLMAGIGSWFVLGSVVTDAPLPPTGEPVGDGCGACTRCLDGCPTNAIVSPGVVDARRCLAWLLQADGSFPESLRGALGDRLYGCDDCQEVCPPSRHGPPSDVRAGGVFDGDRVDILDLLEADDDAIMARHGAWYIARRDPRYVRRNALVVLGNTASVPSSPRVRDVLRRYVTSGDALLVEHAEWAARRLGCHDLIES